MVRLPLNPRLLLAALSLGLLVHSGCGSLFAKKEPPPFVAPPGLKTELAHYAGSSLSGPTTRAVQSAPPREALAVRVRFVSLEKLVVAGRPLAASARLIAADRLGTPVLPSSRLTRSARILELSDPEQFQTIAVGKDGGRTATLYETRSALPRGVTASFAIADPTPLDPRLTGAPATHRLELQIYRPLAAPRPATSPATRATLSTTAPTLSPDAIELAVVVEDLAPLPRETDRTEDAGKETPAAAEIVQRELAVIDRQVLEHDAVAIILPFKLADSSGEAVAAIVEISRDPGTPEHMAALSRVVEDGRRSAARAAQQTSGVVAGGGAAAGLAASLDGLATAQRRRASVVYLAGQTGARLCEDVALVADEATLATLSERVRAAAAAPAKVDHTALGWQLDRATFDLLGQLLSDSKLSPELAAVLITHTGEAGRHPSSFEEVGRNLSSRADFRRRLLDENLIYLEDSSPSARVRAFDWLLAQNHAPDGYDPLGMPRERRAAIERFQTKAATLPSGVP